MLINLLKMRQIWLSHLLTFISFLLFLSIFLIGWLKDSYGKLNLGEGMMSMTNRVLLALGVVALHLVVFFVPLTALFLGYILVYNPPWFREFLTNLDAGQEEK